MRDFIILLRALLVQDYGHTAKEAERLISAHPQVVTNAMMAIGGESGNMVPNLRPCAMALELAEEAIDGHLRKIAESVPTPFKPFPECSNPNLNPNPEEHSDEWQCKMFASQMCGILMDESADQDDKHMALTTLIRILFPDRPIFWDITTHASNCPPSPKQVDAVIAAFVAKADAAGNQGASDEPYIALIVAIEWVLGRESTADWIPCYVAGTIREATGYGTTAIPEKLEEKPEKPGEGHNLLEACKDLLGAMELQQIADEANGNPEAAASCQPFIDKARAAIVEAEGKN